MATEFDRTLPAVLAELHRLEFDYADGKGIDFEPFDEFQSAQENAEWIAAWTGNKKLTASEYRIFGQDGTGGYAAFWLVRKDKPMEQQPIVFFGSEGELGVVASCLDDYLWMLAGGIGPYESLAHHGLEHKPNQEFTAFAAKHAGGAKKSARDVVTAARAEFPEFEAGIRALCR